MASYIVSKVPVVDSDDLCHENKGVCCTPFWNCASSFCGSARYSLIKSVLSTF